jgi:hypothetical protein
MDETTHLSMTPVSLTIDREMNLVREAIAMVATGGSPRVTVAGLHFGEELLPSARRLAAGAGVRIVPLWMLDDMGADITVERIEVE